MIGTSLGHYRIRELIGSGGMGEVYRAADTRLDRDIALKVLPADLAADPARLERFRREAKAVARLNHPNVVTLHSVEEADGVHFLTLELVEGRTLDREIPAHGLPFDRWRRLAQDVLGALVYAHDRGVIHRDLKPSNVMLTPDGRAKVLDFGLAKTVEPEPEGDATRTLADTREGVVMGTVPYMSPEQLQGREVDPRSDLFSVGILLYEAATGDRPFRGDSQAELVSTILRDVPPPPSSVRGSLPPGLDRFLERCLAKDPGHRYASAGEALAAVGALDPVTPASGSRTAAAADDTIAVAVLPFADMSPGKDQDYLCEGMAEEIMSALVRVEGIRVASRSSAFRAGKEGLGPAEIASALSVSHILEGSVRTAGPRMRVTAQLTDARNAYQLWSERYDRGTDDLFAVQDEIAAGVVAAVRARLGAGAHTGPARERPRNLEAYRLYLEGRHLRYGKNDHAGAVRSYEEALRIDPEFAPAWSGLAEVKVLAAFYGLAPLEASLATAREAVATARRIAGETVETCHVEGQLAVSARDWKAAEQALTRGQRLRPDFIEALAWKGMLLATVGRYEEADELGRIACDSDPLAPYPHAMRGVNRLLERRPEQALEHADNALAIEPNNSLPLWTKGLALGTLGRAEEGIPVLERAVNLSHPDGFIHGALGWVYALAGREAEARGILARLEARRKPIGPIVSQAWIHLVLGERDAAWSVLHEARDRNQAYVAFLGLGGYAPLYDDPAFPAFVESLGLTWNP